MNKRKKVGKNNPPMSLAALSLAVLLLLSMPRILLAGESPQGTWGGKMEFSLLTAQGNSSTQTGSLKAKAARETKKDKWIARTGGLLSNSDGAKTAEYYYLNGEYNYHHSELTYSSYFLGWQKDTLAGLNTRLTGRVGLGHTCFKKELDSLVTEAGLAVVYENKKNEASNTFPEGRLFGKYGHTFREGVIFTQEVEGLQDLTMLTKYRINSLSALEVRLNNHWAVKVSLTVQYDHDPAEGFLKTDTFTETSFVYQF
ncbi:MAG: DUF481 domain-containing protein [Deltaproteobacteria bacterium]|nr:DUF481 domain-containing protein [Deltaproteobacteria bacterium]